MYPTGPVVDQFGIRQGLTTLERLMQSCHITTMATVFISDIQIVRVRMPPAREGDLDFVTLWYAAVPRYQAEGAVRAKVPADWAVELTDERVTAEQIAHLEIRHGEVGELVDY